LKTDFDRGNVPNNKYRDENRPSYLASSEAIEINATTTKKPITDNSPFFEVF
jgi:hypothetical protein